MAVEAVLGADEILFQVVVAMMPLLHLDSIAPRVKTDPVDAGLPFLSSNKRVVSLDLTVSL